MLSRRTLIGTSALTAAGVVSACALEGGPSDREVAQFEREQAAEMKAKTEQKKIEEARNSLQRGDKVVTIGGIHGKIVDVKDRTFTIEIARDVRIEVDKAAISFNEAELNSKPESKKEEKKEEEKSEDNE